MDTSIKSLVPKSLSLIQKNILNHKQINFVELMARSNFSFLQGASHPEEMIEQAMRYKYQGLGLCDLGGLYGVAKGFQAARQPSHFTAQVEAQTQFSYLIGTELVLTDESQIILMPLNKIGYSQLCHLITLGKRQAQKGFIRLSIEQIYNHCTDLMAFAIPPITDEKFLDLQKYFEDRLYVPVWKDLTWQSQEFYRQAIRLEEQYGAQLFVTQRPFMHHPDRKPLFDVLTCILHNTTLDEANTKLIQNSERALKPLAEIAELWKERLDLVEKTVEIANRVEFSLDQIRYRYPQSFLPQGLTSTEYLRALTEAGALIRFPQGISSKCRALIEHELQMIKELQYEDYFLTLKEICNFAKEKNILYQGRGSAANSVVCFCLELTAVNPENVDLLFERFISRELNEPPDIDIDFEHQRREEVIQYIYEKFKPEHAAMVCTVIRFRSKMSLRETAKVFGVGLENINSMIKYMGRDGMKRLIGDDSLPHKWSLDSEKWKLILAMSQQIHGFPRHLGIHTGGFLITQDPIIEMVPVEKATMNSRYVIQWNKDDVDTLKLMKIDILGLGMLTALQKCLQLLSAHKDIHYNLATIPQDDKETYQMISAADTVGVFQIESRAQMNALPRVKPQNYYDLVVQVALVRPGPLQGGMVHPYIRRRQGLEKATYAHADLEPILKKTFGVPIFQEQVMKIVIVAAGFSPGEADELRRIMSSAWRKRNTMDSVRLRILTGLQNHGINKDYAEQIYRTIEGFANYGFPESHAASFALLTYASCYLKKHHPDVFVCALLNSQPMGFYVPRTLVAEAQRNQVTFEPLCINRSSYDYTLEPPQEPRKLHPVRLGFRGLSSIPKDLLQKIESERTQNGPYLDLADFIRRTQLPRTILIKLASAGALAIFDSSTRELIWKIEGLQLDQNSFFWGEDKEPQDHHDSQSQEDLESIPKESQWDQMNREYQSQGYSLEHHPLSLLRNYLEAKNDFYRSHRHVVFCDSQKLRSLKHKSKVRLAGLISVTQRPPTAKGMCFITLEDEFGFMNIVIHPDVYQKDRLAIYGGSLLEVQGEIQKTGSLINIKALHVKKLT